jgi:membrane-associated protease RseP (regulator of RpoE activity)
VWLVTICAFLVTGFVLGDEKAKPDQVKPAEGAKPKPQAEVRLGLTSNQLSAKRAADLGLGKNVGVVVSGVDGNTPAGKAGMKKGDILVKIGDRDVPADPDAFRKLIQDLPKGEQLTVVLYRDGARTELPIGPLVPEQRVGRLENQPLPQGRLENQSASEGTTNFNVMAASATQDGFRVFASGEGVSYDIRGRFRNGKRIPTAIKITDEGKVISDVSSLDKVPSGHKDAVNYLLGAVSNK